MTPNEIKSAKDGDSLTRCRPHFCAILVWLINLPLTFKGLKCTPPEGKVSNKPLLSPAIQFIKTTLFISLGVHHYMPAQCCALPMLYNNYTVLFAIVLSRFFRLSTGTRCKRTVLGTEHLLHIILYIKYSFFLVKNVPFSSFCIIEVLL